MFRRPVIGAVIAAWAFMAPVAALAFAPLPQTATSVPTAVWLQDQVRWLADPERAGRQPGDDGHDQARDYLIARFTALGLRPGGVDGGYAQPLTVPLGEGRSAVAANVIGVLEGEDPVLRRQIVVVSAHYDHLGRGPHSQREADRGQIHPGADDNASGVAVLLGAAEELARQPQPRTVIFVAFTGEEQGAVGSRYFVDHYGARDGQLTANLNLDMVGRLHGQPVQVLSTATSPDWEAVFAVASQSAGASVRLAAGGGGGSDQQSFIARDIPAVQVFTGGHDDYHRPTDTADRIDAAGLATVQRLVVEATRELASRSAILTPGVFEQAAPPPDPARPRRVSFGVLPDFSYVGLGVRIEKVTSSLSGEGQAGLKQGDVIEAISGAPIGDLRAYAERLRDLTPGVAVPVRVVRDGARLDLSLTPQEASASR